MQNLEPRSQPKTGGTGRSEGGLSPKKETKPREWEVAHSIDPGRKEDVSTTEKVKLAKGGQEAKEGVTRAEAICSPANKMFRVCMFHSSFTGAVNTSNSYPFLPPHPTTRPLRGPGREGPGCLVQGR